MPSPVLYVMAILSGVAAAIALKEFVYEPHIAPKIERWAENFIAKRQAKRRHREASIAILVRQSDIPGSRINKSDGTNGEEDSTALELEKLVAKEVDEWRNEIDRSQSGLSRRRRNSSKSGDFFEESVHNLSYPTITPTHVISTPSFPSTPTESVPEVTVLHVSSPPPDLHCASTSTLRSPDIAPAGLPTPDASPPDSFVESVNTSSTPPAPPFLDATSDFLDAVSPSRLGSPFSSLSLPGSPSEIPRSLSRMELLSASDDDMDRFSVLSSTVSDFLDEESSIDGYLEERSYPPSEGSVSNRGGQ